MGITEGISYPKLVATSAVLLVSYIFVTAVYRLYFHPLASFPGPFWAKLSTFPSWWHSKNQDRHLWLLSLQEKYGALYHSVFGQCTNELPGTEFRYAPNSVCLNDPKAYKHIFGPKGNVKKNVFYQIWPKTPDHINVWSATSLPVHARKRRVINYAFSESALRSAEVFVHNNVDRWLQLLAQDKKGSGNWTKSIDMADQVTYLVFDILGDLCFGKCFDMKEPDSKLRHIPEVMIGFIALMQPVR